MARTQELGAWSAILLLVLFVGPLLRHELVAIRGLMVRALRMVEDPAAAGALDLLGAALLHALIVLVALGSSVLLVGVAGALSQGGFLVATKVVQPKLAKLSPRSGAKRMFGSHALWQGASALVKAAVVMVLVVEAVRAMMPLLGGIVPASTVLRTASGSILGMFRSVAVAGLLLAAADQAFQRRRIGKQVRMTREEVRQEHKQSEGDPQIRSAMRSHQLALARSRMIAEVPTADVVLVNPTHVAVALKYEPRAGAPTVVARGAGVVATRIREAAAEGRVPLVRDVPLARALYSSCRVGQQIPPELFAAVAQVLAFVISRRRQGTASGEHATPRNHSPLPEVRRHRPRAVADNTSTAAGGSR